MRLVLAIAAMAGFSALVCEAAWFRLLTLILGGSAYSFSLMLVAFLSGIGAGGVWGGRSADRAFRKAGRPAPVVVSISFGKFWLLTENGRQFLDRFLSDVMPFVENRIGKPKRRLLPPRCRRSAARSPS